MKKCITFFALVLLLTAMFFAINTAYANDVNVTIDGQQVSFSDQTPVVVNGHALVPVREIFEALSFDVIWDEVARSVILTRLDDVLNIVVGSSTFTINGVSHTLAAPAQIIGGRTMLTICLVLESIGHSVDWDEAAKTMTISSVPTQVTAFDRLNEVWAEFVNAPSISVEFVQEAEINAGFGVESVQYIMHKQMDLNRDDPEDTQLAMFIAVSGAMGDYTYEMNISSFFRDGYYYADLGIEGQFKMLVPFEILLQETLLYEVDFYLNFEQKAIKKQAIDENVLTFVLEGRLISDQINEVVGDIMAQELGGDAQITFGDIHCLIVLSADGTNIESVTIRVEAFMTRFGETSTSTVTTTMYILQMGDITINFPAGLDNFEEIDGPIF